MKITVLDDFSYTPGPRYEREGKFSGERFRDTVLIPAYKKAKEAGEELIVDLDGTAGLGRSFLEEISGGLIRVSRIPYHTIQKTIKFVAKEEPYYEERVNQYLKQAHEKEKI